MEYSVQSAIEDFDLLSYLIDQGAEEEKDGEEFVLPCPECGKEKLTVNLEKRAWHCWVCEDYRVDAISGKAKPVAGAGGIISLVQTLEGVDKHTAVEKIMAASRISIAQLEHIDENLIKQSLDPKPTHAGAIEPPPHWEPVTGILPYMQQRGITYEDAQAFGLGFCREGRYAGRLIFPVWEGGSLTYYQGRAMMPGLQPKTLNPPSDCGVGSTEVLMNLDNAKEYPRVAITEGPIDCVKAGKSAVCTFGKKISATQIQKLKQVGVQNLDLMWDSDAIPEMEGTAKTLRVLFNTVRIVRLPEGTDPGDHTRDQLNWFRANSRADDHALARI
jgi:DNA primase